MQAATAGGGASWQQVGIIGDIHGHMPQLQRLLKQANLIDDQLNWCGADFQLWFTGDFVDRGPQGIATIELIMRLQQQATEAGGSIHALLGNHDLLLLAVYRFGNARALLRHLPDEARLTHIPAQADIFTRAWLRNGGILNDLRQLNAQHIRWISALPLMAHANEALLIHADASFYRDYGASAAEVNATIRQIIRTGNITDWNRLLNAFSQHEAFSQPDGITQARRLLERYGGRQIIHGHTPINKGRNANIIQARSYAEGLCVNVDAGIYLGSDGFIYRHPPSKS